MFKNIIHWIAVQIASHFHSITSADIKAAIDLVIQAQQRYSLGGQKLAWVAEQLGRITTGLFHPDGSPTNKLNLIVSVAIDLAERFDLMPPKKPADPAAPTAAPQI